MGERIDNVETILSPKIPGEPCASIFLYDDTVSDWSNSGSVVVKGVIEVLSI